MERSDGLFKWQAGYGALTVGESSLETVMEYAAKQKEHHKAGTMIDVYERMDEEDLEPIRKLFEKRDET